jgi:hypothetical protein
MRIATRTYICVGSNTLAFLFLLLAVIFGTDTGTLFQYGPADDLIVLTAKIDTWTRYIALLSAIGLVRIVEVLVNDIGGPALGFSIYNPTSTVVYGFTYRGLAIAANIQWTIRSLTGVFKTLVIISRFDMAIFSVLISELVSGSVVHYLLSSKTFIPDFDTKDEYEASRDVEMGLRDNARL